MFCNYSVQNKLNLANEDILESEYERFSKKYIDENKLAHGKWYRDNVVPFGKDKKENSIYTMTFLDLNQEMFSSSFERLYLDKRYVIVENHKIFSINPLISKMMREMYLNQEFLEN